MCKLNYYLLLDMKDITVVYRRVSSTELLGIIGIKNCIIKNWINNCGIIDGKYIVIEDE